MEYKEVLKKRLMDLPNDIKIKEEQLLLNLIQAETQEAELSRWKAEQIYLISQDKEFKNKDMREGELKRRMFEQKKDVLNNLNQLKKQKLELESEKRFYENQFKAVRAMVQLEILKVE